MKKYRTSFSFVGSRTGTIYFQIEVDDGNGWKRLNNAVYSKYEAERIITETIDGEKEWVCLKYVVN